MDYGKGSAMPIRLWDEYGYHGPGIGTVVRLGGGGRSQFIVGRWEGASTSFMSLYGVLNGKLVMIPFHGGPAADSRIGLGFGGTAAASTSVRCVRGGPLTILSLSGWVEKGKRFSRFSRYTYRLRPDGFRLTQTKTTTATGDDKTRSTPSHSGLAWAAPASRAARSPRRPRASGRPPKPVAGIEPA